MREHKFGILIYTTLCFVLIAIGTQPLLAQSEADALPATFVPITNEGWLSDGSQIVIGCENAQDQSIYIAEAVASGNFLNANKTDYRVDDPITIEQSVQVWTLEASGSNFLLRNAGLYVAKGKTDTSFKLSDNRSEAIPFSITRNADNTFELSNSTAEGRYFCLELGKVGNDYTYVFGNYKSVTSNRKVLLYRYEKASLHIDGEAIMPDDGIQVCLFSKNNLLSLNASVDASTYLLSNSTLAASVPALILNTEVRDATHIALLNNAGNYLNDELKMVPDVVWWELKDGSLWQNGRILQFLPNDSRFVTLTSDDALEQDGESVVFIPVADKAEQVLSDGVLSVTNGLSAKELAALDWQDAYMLDLSHAPLPFNAVPFTNRPKDANTIVLINTQDSRFVCDQWEFVVAKDESNDYNLITQAQLTDRNPLRLPADINANNSQVIYTRTLCGDGGWETIVLPFDADVPNDMTLEMVSSIDEQQVTFTECKAVKAGISMLMRPIDSTTQTVTFLSLAGKLSTQTAGDFQGNYLPFTLETNQPHTLYMLNADGSRFVRAASGSRLAPFRAALQSDATRSVRHFNRH